MTRRIWSAGLEVPSRAGWSLCLLAVVSGAVLSAAVIHVPSEQPTIQAGLTAANSGDTVLVAPGHYKERIVWPGRDGIRLLSELGRDSTDIDADTGDYGISLTGGQTRATEIRGFTVTNSRQAGIYCHMSSPSILNNRLSRCGWHGLYLIYADNVLVRGNEVCGNAQDSIANYQDGAGIYVSASNSSSHPEVCYNHVHHDSLAGAYYSEGAGIYCDASALIYQNWVDSNYIRGYSWLGYGYGGGICLAGMNTHPLVFNNLITGNKVNSWYKFGAGIYVSSSPATVLNNTVVNNVCTSGGYPEGGGLYNEFCTTYVRNNIIAGNTAGSGSGVYNADYGSSGIVSGHNDYYGNTLYNCAMGPGDILGDPLFASGAHGAYYLSQTLAGQPGNSPCLDAGDTLLMTLPLNLDSLLQVWTTRTDSAPDAGQPDIGYHYPLEQYPARVREEPCRFSARQMLSASPNPFRAQVKFSCPVRERGMLTVFDASGRQLEGFSLPAGAALTWNAAGLPAGAYFCRLVAGSQVAWTSLTKLR
jgi:parallel beta-helix repeat protein